MLVGEVAERAGLSARQVRYYTDQGLLPARRRSNGYRDYGVESVERAARIHTLFSMGLTSEQVRGVASCLSESPTRLCDATRSALSAQLRDIDVRIAELTAARAIIERRLAVT